MIINFMIEFHLLGQLPTKGKRGDERNYIYIYIIYIYIIYIYYIYVRVISLKQDALE